MGIEVEDVFKIDTITVPIPQRFNLLIVLASWLWVGILTVSYKSKMEVTQLISTHAPHDLKPDLSIQQVIKSSHALALQLSKVVLPSHIVMMMLWNLKKVDSSGYLVQLSISTGHIMPLIQFLVIFYIILEYSSVISYCMRRLVFIETNPRQLRTTYILISDSLTSFTKPLVDFTLYVSIIFFGELKFQHIDLFVAQLPVFIRIFQCLREYKLHNYQEKNPLFNSMKYASSLPIIFCMWVGRAYTGSSQHLKGYQKFFMLINSCYSFFWDLRMDWSLNSFKTYRTNSDLTFSKQVYQMCILFDFIVRFWWVWISVGSLMNANIDTAMIFDGEIQYLEIFRRAMWIVLRLESEHIVKLLVQ